MADYYIALPINGGSDSNNGLSPGAPFATIQHAYDVVRGLSNNGAGRVIQMRGGTYDQVISNPNANGNSVQGYIKLQNYPGETVWLKPTKTLWGGSAFVIYLTGQYGGTSYLEFDGINFDGEFMDGGVYKLEAVQSNGAEAHHIITRNCEMLGCMAVNLSYFAPNWVSLQSDMANQIGWAEFYYVKCHRGGPLGEVGYPSTWGLPEQSFYINFNNVIIDHCECIDTNGAGFQVYSHSGLALHGVTISNNWFHDYTRYMVADPYKRITVGTVYGPHDGIKIFNNRFTNCGAAGTSTIGLSLAAGATNPLVYNNTFVNIQGDGLQLGRDGGITGGYVRNNGAWNCNRNFYQEPGGVVGTTIDYNMNFSGTPTDPQFVDVSYHIADTSPWRGQGIPSGFFTTDFDGDTRGASVWDVGADEFSTEVASDVYDEGLLYGTRILRTHRGAPRQYADRQRLRSTVHGRNSQRR